MSTITPSTDAGFLQAVLEGLEQNPRTLPCRYFYDAEGSRLFEEICDLPEYYLTRAEDEILQRHAGEIVQTLGHEVELVELGSGSSRKTRRLLSALLERQRRLRYVPVDIAHTMLAETAVALSREYPRLEVAPLAAEYGEAFHRLRGPADERRLVLFLGSNLGNFTPPDARVFLRSVREICPEGWLLIGLDLAKDPAVLNTAYDDPRGVTARFNLNLLRHINRELGADFDLSGWAHQAAFYEDRSRVEMHLVSLRQQRVTVGGRPFQFQAGEMIHTENSHKFTLPSISQLAADSGFRVERTWFDSREWFTLSLFAAI